MKRIVMVVAALVARSSGIFLNYDRRRRRKVEYRCAEESDLCVRLRFRPS
ncbi:hypothetical protein [Paraburkholderia fungorum]